MQIHFNNSSIDIIENSSIKDFINTNNIDVRGIAIALNHKVVPQVKWNDTILKENDNILIIKATQGG